MIFSQDWMERLQLPSMDGVKQWLDGLTQEDMDESKSAASIINP